MKRCAPAILALLLPLLLAGCRRPGVYLAPGAPFRLCLPEDGPELFVTQEAEFLLPGGRRETALATLENHAGTLRLVASTPLGLTLFVVTVQGAAATVDARVPLPAALDPKLLAALVQFALWPADAVGRSLGPGTEFLEDGPRRSLLRHGKVLWRVTRDGAAPPFRSLLLENPALGLTVRIRTRED